MAISKTAIRQKPNAIRVTAIAGAINAARIPRRDRGVLEGEGRVRLFAGANRMSSESTTETTCVAHSDTTEPDQQHFEGITDHAVAIAPWPIW